MSGLEWFFLVFFLAFLPYIFLASDSSLGELTLPLFGVIGELIYLWNTYESNISIFLKALFIFISWTIIGLAILRVIYLFINSFLKAKRKRIFEEEERKRIETEKRLKEEERKRIETEKRLKEEEKHRIKEIEILEKTMSLEEIKKKNKQLEEDIIFLKPIVSGLSIYDDDFLEQQPKILNFIDEVIAKGGV